MDENMLILIDAENNHLIILVFFAFENTERYD